MIRSALFRSILGVGLLFAQTVYSAEVQSSVARGKEKIQMCVGCHGIEGWRTAFPRVYTAPRLGGQHAAYIKRALEAYKTGERNHPSMRAIAGSLSDQDMADLAAYYSAQRP